VSDDYDHVLHDVDGGPILRKLRHPKPDLSAPIDPLYYSPFVAEKHEKIIKRDMDLLHLKPNLQERIYGIIRRHWSVFDKKGVFVPVKHYECVINTGNSRPIAVKKILYGEQETVIMRKCITALAKVGHIRQITDGGWLFKALLAAKPHQEHVRCIDDFVWQFCVNYIPLDSVTRLIAYPIPRCDSAIHNKFGQGKWCWMFDAPMGYHQLAVAPLVKRSVCFKESMPSSGPIQSCHLGLPMGRQRSSTSFTTSTASGRNLLKSTVCLWKTIRIQRSSSTTSLVGLKYLILL
jgi:hypothetical protein